METDYYWKYRKYKNQYLALKAMLQGESQMTDEMDFSDSEISGKISDENMRQLSKAAMEIHRNLLNRYYIVYRQKTNSFDRVKGGDLMRSHNIKMRVVGENHLIFIINLEGDKKYFAFESYISGGFAVAYTHEEGTKTSIYSELPIDNKTEEEMINLYKNCESMKRFTNFLMNTVLNVPVFDLPQIGVGDRFGNIMFPIARWISFLAESIKSDFIIGISFVYRGIRSLKDKRDVYFEDDITTFFGEHLEEWEIISYEGPIPGYDKFLSSILDDPYRFINVEAQYEDEGWRGGDKLIKTVKISTTMNQKLIKEFCRFYVRNKNPRLIDLTVPKSHVAIHFRGSDFCITKENVMSEAKFLVLHFSYYLEALRQLSEQPERIVIFATPIDKYIVSIMKEYLRHHFPATDFLSEDEFLTDGVSGVAIDGPLELIMLISKFDKIILGNSSFAYWCGFLSDASAVMGWFRRYPADTILDEIKRRGSGTRRPKGDPRSTDISQCVMNDLAYAGSLEYMDVMYKNWININTCLPCGRYLFPCRYVWIKGERVALNHLDLFSILYSVWNGSEYDPKDATYETKKRAIREIIDAIRTAVDIDGTFDESEKYNSISNSELINKLRKIARSHSRRDLVELIDDLYFTSHVLEFDPIFDRK